jgi:hypothetical protein
MSLPMSLAQLEEIFADSKDKQYHKDASASITSAIQERERKRFARIDAQPVQPGSSRPQPLLPSPVQPVLQPQQPLPSADGMVEIWV